jgi:hypothetical protein
LAQRRISSRRKPGMVMKKNKILAFANQGGSRNKTELGGNLDPYLLLPRTSDLFTEDKIERMTLGQRSA